MRKFDESYLLLAEMYDDDYYPNHLVDKVKNLVLGVINYLENNENNTEEIQVKFDEMIVGINDLEEEFNEADSEIETVARESIGDTVEYILKYFEIDIDVETAIQEREW